MSVINHDFVPSDAEELRECLADPMWRVCSGRLYKIMVKDETQSGGTSVMPFRPNRTQKRFIKRLWFRNLILKARQLGFTTLVAILWLDHALFNPNQRCGIVAHDREAAENIFRDKVKFAYENLPHEMRQLMPLAKNSATELLFAHNNSSVRVATSMRSGMIHRLHVSEFGKICAKYPDKAREVVTGSLPAVPLNGIAIIESTAEGTGGAFHDMSERAEARSQIDRPLNQREYRFHFYAWWTNVEYQMDPAGVVITAKDHEYFDTVEAAVNTTLSLQQRAWYVATRETEFAGDPEKMWQEYPSTSKEAFQKSTEGTYYAVQLAAARKSSRIGIVPAVSHVPVNTFWDIGNRDGTAIWLHQRVGLEHRFIGYVEGHGEPYDYYVKELEKFGVVWGRHYLPHDATHQRQQEREHAAQKASQRPGVAAKVGGLPQKQQDDGHPNQKPAQREQANAAIGHAPTGAQVTQLHHGALQKIGLIGVAGPVFHHTGAVDDARQAPRHRANHAGHGRQQENRGHGQLDAVGDGAGFWGNAHGRLPVRNQRCKSAGKRLSVCSRGSRQGTHPLPLKYERNKLFHRPVPPGAKCPTIRRSLHREMPCPLRDGSGHHDLPTVQGGAQVLPHTPCFALYLPRQTPIHAFCLPRFIPSTCPGRCGQWFHCAHACAGSVHSIGAGRTRCLGLRPDRLRENRCLCPARRSTRRHACANTTRLRRRLAMFFPKRWGAGQARRGLREHLPGGG